MRLLLAALLWLITFPIAWAMLPKIMLKKIDDYRFGIFEWLGIRMVYAFIIILPYLPLITYTELSQQFLYVVYSLLFLSVLSMFVRLFYREQFIKKLWLIYGYVYDGLLLFYPYKQLVEQMSDRVVSVAGKKPVNILDLGCGTGNLARAVLNKCPNARSLVCVDMSPSMLRVARKKLFDNRVTVVDEDIVAFLKSSRAKSYDIVVLMNVLYTQSDGEELIAEVAKVLKARGSLVITDPVKGGNTILIKDHIVNDSWLKLLHPKLIIVWIVDNFISEISNQGKFNFRHPDKLNELLTDSGLRVVNGFERTYGGSTNGVNIIATATVE